MPHRNRNAESHGFTLVELLVVIAVIGLLCGILFPVFASAKKASFRSTCQSNLKQLYTAFLLYADDWNETFPCPGGLYGSWTYWAQQNGGGLDKYLRNQRAGPKSVYCCPCYAGEWHSEWSPRTYCMNSFLREPADIAYPGSLAYLCGIRCTEIVVPCETILLYEGIPADKTNTYGEGYVYRCADWQWVRGYCTEPILHWQDAEKPWHGDRNNYLFCDGHVISMAPETYETFRGPTCPENNLWYARKFRDLE